MKRFFVIVFVVFCISSVFAVNALAKGGQGKGMSNTAYGRLYNPSTVESFSGVVEEYGVASFGRGMSQGVHLVIKTDKETLSVHLGPVWYMNKQTIQIAKGDKVEIVGSRVVFNDNPAIIASSVKKGDQTLMLRDPKGVPAWAGSRGGR
jgi:hypothetical protein